jgi:hypothetical protein
MNTRTCIIAALVFGLSLGLPLHGQEKHQRSSQHHLITALPNKTYLNTNNISTLFWNNGFADIDSFNSNSRFVFPKGTGKTAVFKSGLMWGAKLNGEIRVGGSTYRTGLQPGRILFPGMAESPNLPVNRIYRVRADYRTGELTSETMDEGRNAALVRAQYERDWEEWPAGRGAPFDDRNGDGVYDPATDVPGVKGATQTIWFVCNDLDSVLTTNLYGSRPLGIEMQVTIWGYAAAGPMGDVLFKSYLLINKSTSVFDSMYVCQWVDPDVGDANDDLVGCDTTLSLGFAYNGFETDRTYFPLPPPAVGFKIAQGPLVPYPGGTGRLKGRVVHGFKNLPMTAFYYCARSDFFLDDCGVMGSYNEGTLRLYTFFKGRVGRTGQLFVDPQGNHTTFAMAGDPVSGYGWIDGQVLPPGDRRFGVCSGPFVMAVGDTQEVIIAQVAGLGDDRLSSVTRMKINARIAQSAYDNFFLSLPPYPSVKTQFISSQSTRVALTADARGTTALSISSMLRKYNGDSVVTFTLFDDGLHGDGAANDQIFANAVSVVPLGEGIHADLNITYLGGHTARWSRIVDEISTAGPIDVPRYTIASDNINSDGRVQRGENIRLGITVRNGSQFGFSNIGVTGPNGAYHKKILLGDLTPQGTVSNVYNPTDPSTYLMFDVPSDFAEREMLIPLNITDSLHNRWTDTLLIPVWPLPFPVRNTPLLHVSGRADGGFDISVVDLTKVKPHIYVIQGVDSVDSAGSPGITLRDSTSGTTLLHRHLLPDILGHLVPLTDGFKILRGSINTSNGMRDWQVPSGTRRFTFADTDSGGATFGLEGFEHSIGWAGPTWFSGSTVTSGQLKNVLLKLATASSSTTGFNNDPGFVTPQPYAGWNRLTTTDENMSYAYRYMRLALNAPARPEFAQFIVNPSPGYAYQDYTKSVPFSAWDIEADPPRRLAVGHLENNQPLGMVDGCWWPISNGAGVTNVASNGPREWFFIFDMPYTDTTPDPTLQRDIINVTLPIMWWGLVNRRAGTPFPAPTGSDQFLILAHHSLTSADRYVFSLDSIVQNFVPSSYQLLQNYPNPFNPATTISYGLPTLSRVVIKIYNVLGQEVRVLLDDVQQLGFNSVVWDGANSEGILVSTGVYFYRIEASSLTDPSQSFTQVKKMMVLR